MGKINREKSIEDTQEVQYQIIKILFMKGRIIHVLVLSLLVLSGCCSFTAQDAEITPGVEYILTVETLDSARTETRISDCSQIEGLDVQISWKRTGGDLVASATVTNNNPDYVVRITGSDPYGKSKLKYFISVNPEGPVIATTSKLLSTGADCKMTKLIVLDEMISSMTEFKQIIGRGTRLREKDGKSHFVVMDFRNVTRLFSDPDWDGPIEMVDGYDPNPKKKGGNGPDNIGGGTGSIDPPLPRVKPIVDENGCDVHIIGKRVEVYDSDGKLLRQESIVDYTKSNILGKYASLDNFILKWTSEEKKEAIRELLREQGIDLEQMKADQGMSDVDDFDFICHVAYDQKPLTRRERANNVKKRDFLSKYSGVARDVLEALLEKYMNSGIYEIEKTEILQLDPFKKFGKPSKIATYFGGKDGYLKAIKELEAELYKVS